MGTRIFPTVENPLGFLPRSPLSSVAKAEPWPLGKNTPLSELPQTLISSLFLILFNARCFCLENTSILVIADEGSVLSGASFDLLRMVRPFDCTQGRTLNVSECVRRMVSLSNHVLTRAGTVSERKRGRARVKTRAKF